MEYQTELAVQVLQPLPLAELVAVLVAVATLTIQD
jgi:hypothetical protein